MSIKVVCFPIKGQSHVLLVLSVLCQIVRVYVCDMGKFYYILLKHDVMIMDGCGVIMVLGILAAPLVAAVHMVYICHLCFSILLIYNHDVITMVTCMLLNNMFCDWFMIIKLGM